MPAWLTPADRVLSDPAWLETLNREQRIIMRSYDNAYSNAKPPASEFPLFLDRETGLDRNPDAYREMSSCTAASAAPGPSARRRLRRFPDPLEG